MTPSTREIDRDQENAAVVLERCEKCGSANISVSYHPRCSYCDPHSRFTFNSRGDEHLHYHCRRCSFDWTGDTYA